MHNKDDQLFFHRLSRLQRLYSKALARRLALHGVKPGYIDILDRLWRKDNITQKELHESLDIKQATLSNTLQRMERDGILRRVRNDRDRRMTFVVLTEQGHAQQKVVQASIDDVHTTATAGLTVNDRRYFYRILKQMAEHLDTDPEDTALILVDEVTD